MGRGAADLDALAVRAKAGDPDARRLLLRALERLVFNLAMRFFGDPTDAEDATQEVLLLVDRSLPAFEGRSKVTTWVHTIAMRRFLRSARGRAEAQALGPAELQAALDATATAPAAEEELVSEAAAAEIRLACTHGILLALSRPARAAYLLVELAGLTDAEAAAVLEVDRAAVRQRVARARRAVAGVVAGRCRLTAPETSCTCRSQAAATGRVAPVYLPLAEETPGVATVERAAAQLSAADAAIEVYRSSPQYVPPERIWKTLQELAPDLAG